jgi:hypothetical protein
LETKLPATEPFPGFGFQITTEAISADDLPRNEQNRSNPIRRYYRLLLAKDKRQKGKAEDREAGSDFS